MRTATCDACSKNLGAASGSEDVCLCVCLVCNKNLCKDCATAHIAECKRNVFLAKENERARHEVGLMIEQNKSDGTSVVGEWKIPAPDVNHFFTVMLTHLSYHDDPGVKCFDFKNHVNIAFTKILPGPHARGGQGTGDWSTCCRVGIEKRYWNSISSIDTSNIIQDTSMRNALTLMPHKSTLPPHSPGWGNSTTLASTSAGWGNSTTLASTSASSWVCGSVSESSEIPVSAKSHSPKAPGPTHVTSKRQTSKETPPAFSTLSAPSAVCAGRKCSRCSHIAACPLGRCGICGREDLCQHCGSVEGGCCHPQWF